MPPPQAATPSLLRAINLRATFELVHAGGPVAAPHLARETGLSKPTVSEVLGQLLELGLLHRVGRTSGAPGPSAQLYDVNPRAGWVLSIDVGRRFVRHALTDLTGTVIGRASEPTRRSAHAVIAQIRATAERLAGDAGISLGDLHQVVVGTPGVTRPGENHLSLAPQLPGWERAEVLSAIRQALIAPVVFENDVNLAAVGEHVEGVARGCDDFVLIAVGSGVGMAAIVDGGLRRGASGLAGEIGYLPMLGGQARRRGAATWGPGQFEQLVSAATVVAVARQRGLTPAGGAAAIFAAAREGDAEARAVVEIEAGRLAQGVAAVATVLDPELVVLGGGIGAGGGDLLVPMIKAAMPTISPFAPRLAVSTLGADAVLIGAGIIGLRLALDRIFGVDGNRRRPPTNGSTRAIAPVDGEVVLAGTTRTPSP